VVTLFLTYKILTADAGHVIYRSLLRPVTTDDANLRASMLVGEPDTHNEILKSRDDFSNVKNMDEYKLAETQLPSPVFNPQDLIGWSFLMEEQPDGQKTTDQIVQLIEDHESSLEDNPTRTKFRVSVNNDRAEEIITYNKMLEYHQRGRIRHHGEIPSNNLPQSAKISDYSLNRMVESGDHQRTP
jgi:hypothetical protein